MRMGRHRKKYMEGHTLQNIKSGDTSVLAFCLNLFSMNMDNMSKFFVMGFFSPKKHIGGLS